MVGLALSYFGYEDSDSFQHHFTNQQQFYLCLLNIYSLLKKIWNIGGTIEEFVLPDVLFVSCGDDDSPSFSIVVVVVVMHVLVLFLFLIVDTTAIHAAAAAASRVILVTLFIKGLASFCCLRCECS